MKAYQAPSHDISDETREAMILAKTPRKKLIVHEMNATDSNSKHHKTVNESRRRKMAADPEGWKKQRAVWDKNYKARHAPEIAVRNHARYAANRESELARAHDLYEANPMPKLTAALRRYRRIKSKLPPGQVEFPIAV